MYPVKHLLSVQGQKQRRHSTGLNMVKGINNMPSTSQGERSLIHNYLKSILQMWHQVLFKEHVVIVCEGHMRLYKEVC